MRDYTRNIFFCFRQKSRESTKTTRTKISLQKKKTKKNNKETKRFVERKTRGKKRERERRYKPRAVFDGEKKNAALFAAKTKKKFEGIF